jgi:glycosyltransferase involved in cell wall biosynthesis
VVARLEWQKNLPMLFKAFASLRLKVPEAVLAVAGDGTLREELEAEAQGIAPRSILFLGRVPYDQLPALFQAADLSVLPSHHETSARVLSLSLLAGTPVLSTDTTGAREVIEDRVTGRIVPVGDLEMFTAALVEMCVNLEARREMGLHAREQMIKKISIESVVSALREMYLKILEKGA